MQKQLLELGLISRGNFLKNIIIRVPVRLLPGKLLSALYNRFARG